MSAAQRRLPPSKEALGLALLLALAAALALARPSGHGSLTETGLRLLAAARAHDFSSEAPAWTLAMSWLGPRAGILFELAALALSYRVLRALRVSPSIALVALSPLALDRALAAAVVSGEPAAAALFGFALLVALQVVRAGALGRIGASPYATAAVCAFATLLSFDLAVAALAVAIARHPTRRIALLLFLGATLGSRLALGDLVPAPIASQAALLARLPALWAIAARGRYLAALSENVDAFAATAAAFPLAIGAGFFAMAILTRDRARVCARTLRLAAPLAGAVLACALFAYFVAPSASRTLPLVAGSLLLVACGLDRVRTSKAPVIALAIVVANAATVRAPLLGHPTIVVAGPVLCAPCGESWLARRDLVSLDNLDEAGRTAIRAGTLLAYLRTRGVVALAIDPQLVNEALLGPRAREELVPDGAIFRIERPSDDALVLHGVVLAAAPAFAAHVGDGFSWSNGGAASRAPRAELSFVAPPDLRPTARLQLLMRAAVSESQPVELTLDGTKVGRVLAVIPPRWFDVPLTAAKIGRSRVRLGLPGARPIAGQGPDAWRSPNGRLLAAVVVEGLRVVTGDEPMLPPRGAGLEDARFDRLLRSGFMAVERDAKPPGVWATGKAEIAFFLTPVNGPLVLTLEAGPPPDGDQRVTAILNGHPLGELHFPAASIETRTLAVPEAFLVDGDNVLTLSFARIQAGRALYLRHIALEEQP